MIFIDANIFMYAAGHESPQQQPCQRFLAEVVRRGAPACCTNAEVLQEILHRYRAIGRADIGFRIFDSVAGLGIPILGVGASEVRRARRLLDTYPTLSTRDGVHLGVMEEHGMTAAVSYDRGLDQVSWLERREP